MNLKQFLKNKLSPPNIKYFFRSHMTLISLFILVVALVYGGILIYSYAFRPLWFPQDGLATKKTSLNKNLYNDVFEDFLEREARLEKGINKQYNDPFKY